MEISRRISHITHITLNFLAVLGKRYQSSGIADVLVESDVYGPGTVTSLMKGKSYNRRVSAHKLTMEALFRLRWQAFICWLNAECQHPHKANLDQKGLVSSMQSFHLAIKSKEDVPQRSMSITVELKTVMELFETFREQERARSPMFSFWDEYIRMVMMFLQFVMAERTGNWRLHLAAASSMTPYFFAHDRHNYSRSCLLSRHGTTAAEAPYSVPEVHGRRPCHKPLKPTFL